MELSVLWCSVGCSGLLPKLGSPFLTPPFFLIFCLIPPKPPFLPLCTPGVPRAATNPIASCSPEALLMLVVVRGKDSQALPQLRAFRADLYFCIFPRRWVFGGCAQSYPGPFLVFFFSAGGPGKGTPVITAFCG